MAELRQVIYQRELEKLVFPDNSFFLKSRRETGIADSCETWEKPVQGSINKAKEGEPDSYPLTVKKADDDKKTFSVSKIYAEPLLITYDSDLLTNYNKRQTKQEQQASEINTMAAERTAYNWAAIKASNIISTTGDARASNVIGLTGQRKAVCKADLLKTYNVMMRMQFEGGRWYALVTPDFYTDLLAIPDFVDYEKTGATSKLEQGVVGKLFGVEYMVRSNEANHTGLLYKIGGAVRVGVGAQITATDLPANLFWNDRAVCTAEGRLNCAINNNAPGYLSGTIVESWMRYGADKVRDDERGILTILEAATA